MRSIAMAIAVGLLAALATGAAFGQTRVDVKRDWSIFESGQGEQKVCFIATQPKKSSATRGGQTVQVRRGDIFLMVSIRPADKVKSEVVFVAGYPFKEGSNATLTIGSNEYKLFTDGENAWAASPDQDDRITAAFRAGADAQVEGVSSRGTTTHDTFSLLGFTDALEAARERCH